MKNSTKWGTQTLCVVSGSDVDFSTVRTPTPPIFQSSNYTYENVDIGTEILTGEKPGYIYSRYSNPTVDVVNQVVAEIEGGEEALSFSSGLAAISATALAYCQPGDHIVASSLIYGGTYHLFQEHLGRLNIETTFVNPADTDEVARSIRKNTRLLYVEPLANPTLVSADIKGWAELAHQHRCKLVVDNTFTPPPIFFPLRHGADVVIHSATKYLGGHSDLVGGVVVSSRQEIETIRPILKYFGGIISPMIAWLLLRGIRTLGIRLERQCTNAEAMARFLESHSKIQQVNYAGLPSNPQFPLNRKQFNGYSGMLSFEVKGGFQAAKKVMQQLQLIKFTVSLGDVATLISHPASTSHIYLTPEERASIGVTDGLLRISAGIEETQDLLEDLNQALGAID
ncbi:MAG: PLP-dependent aspartate aminotransferase family protein [Calditrichia bacterium]